MKKVVRDKGDEILKVVGDKEDEILKVLKKIPVQLSPYPRILIFLKSLIDSVLKERSIRKRRKQGLKRIKKVSLEPYGEDTVLGNNRAQRGRIIAQLLKWQELSMKFYVKTSNK